MRSIKKKKSPLFEGLSVESTGKKSDHFINDIELLAC